ncbi:RNAse III [Desulfofundulus australicus DSM 11792]|jgi:ribonuclease-3|uniref:Ribonuclease 3 n=1 Tax=Desulfofundulus australicus DSM 11792 TaxID=1121425 RepID=A0A1M4UA09_9FIRM|nr:ribonuclease III [Desulfofundulus australicus]SHE53691.1 RNAse III [Desulfofundulus australicus DSM 11792]
MAHNQEKIKILKERLGFNWQNEDLLHLALTHSSYAYEKNCRGQENNQRLEFLGDAVLELVVSDYLYRTYPGHTEGELTRLRAAIVCEPSLARIARNLELGFSLYMGRGEERSGGRERPSILADAFEALLGAIYLDQGLEVARKVALKFLEPVINDVLEGRMERDYKTELQEILQEEGVVDINYTILHEEGPDHHKTFTAAVYFQGREMGRGQGRSKKEAEQQAACQALARLGYLQG